MSGPSKLPDETFAPAPAGARIRVVTLLMVAVFVGVMGLNAWLVTRSELRDAWVALMAPVIIIPIVAAVGGFARIRALRLAGDRLVVERPVFPVTYTLADLESVEPDRNPLAGARKVMGNDGIGAVSGRFRSKRLGSFRVHLSDSACGVIIRTKAETIVVSPAQPVLFVDAVRRRVREFRGA